MTISHSLPEWLRDWTEEFLTAVEREQLDVLFARIWPRDDARGIPGALDVAASLFVSRLLARSIETFRDIPKWQRLYRSGLQALDDYSREKYRVPLTGLDASQTDEILGGLEGQSLTGLSLPDGTTQYALFDTLRRHCIQGCLSDPRWGGNTDRRMWRALGILQSAEATR